MAKPTLCLRLSGPPSPDPSFTDTSCHPADPALDFRSLPRLVIMQRWPLGRSTLQSCLLDVYVSLRLEYSVPRLCSAASGPGWVVHVWLHKYLGAWLVSCTVSIHLALLGNTNLHVTDTILHSRKHWVKVHATEWKFMLLNVFSSNCCCQLFIELFQ